MIFTEPIHLALAPLIREIVREELDRRPAAAAPTAPEPELLGVPQAAGRSGIPAATIRAWIDSGRLPRRLKNHSPSPGRPIYLVSIPEVLAASAGGAPSSQALTERKERADEQADRILRGETGHKRRR